MPALADHPSTTKANILIASDSGTGKTGGLASLANAGHHLRILDFDNGVSVLRGYLRPEAISNVHYVPLFDTFDLKGKKVGVAKATAFKDGMEILETGKQGSGKDAFDPWGDDPGPLETWPAEDTLVVDTFSSMGRSALALVMALEAKGFSNPEIQHYGIAMDNLEKFIGMITSDAVKCNVIVNTHIQTSKEGGAGKLYPEALGDKLAPKIGRYFDNMITISISGGKKVYKTQRDGMFACKTAIPMDAEYPLEGGLLKIFEKLTKGK